MGRGWAEATAAVITDVALPLLPPGLSRAARVPWARRRPRPLGPLGVPNLCASPVRAAGTYCSEIKARESNTEVEIRYVSELKK